MVGHIIRCQKRLLTACVSYAYQSCKNLDFSEVFDEFYVCRIHCWILTSYVPEFLRKVALHFCRPLPRT